MSTILRTGSSCLRRVPKLYQCQVNATRGWRRYTTNAGDSNQAGSVKREDVSKLFDPANRKDIFFSVTDPAPDGSEPSKDLMVERVRTLASENVDMRFFFQYPGIEDAREYLARMQSYRPPPSPMIISSDYLPVQKRVHFLEMAKHQGFRSRIIHKLNKGFDVTPMLRRRRQCAFVRMEIAYLHELLQLITIEPLPQFSRHLQLTAPKVSELAQTFKCDNELFSELVEGLNQINEAIKEEKREEAFEESKRLLALSADKTTEKTAPEQETPLS